MLALLGTFIDLTEDSIDFLYDFKSKFNLLNANWNAEWKYFVFPMMMLAECVNTETVEWLPTATSH